MAVSFGQEWRDDAEAIIPRLGSALEKPRRRAEAQVSREDAARSL